MEFVLGQRVKAIEAAANSEQVDDDGCFHFLIATRDRTIRGLLTDCFYPHARMKKPAEDSWLRTDNGF